jgi:hypothetical protein
VTVICDRVGTGAQAEPALLALGAAHESTFPGDVGLRGGYPAGDRLTGGLAIPILDDVETVEAGRDGEKARFGVCGRSGIP